MDVLPCNFRILHRLGFWQENGLDRTIFRTTIRIVIIILLLYLAVTEVIELFRLDAEELIPNLMISMCFMGLIMKMFNFLIRRDELIKLLEKFRSNVCQPQTTAEAKILDKYSKLASKLHKYFIYFAAFCSSIVSVIPLVIFLETSELELPIKSYHPYDTSKSSTFWSTYVIQGVLEVYAAVLNCSFDTVTCGFILIATGQFELCYYRLQSCINDGSFNSSNCKNQWFTHHVLAISIIKDIQKMFMGVIVPFFFCNMIVLCAIIFRLYMVTPFSTEFFTHIIYYKLILIQAFIYCWSGHGLIVKYKEIANAAYHSNWTGLELSDRKCLIFIMRIGQQAITISLKGQFGLAMPTFTWIVKTSYGMFNLLQRVSRS